MKGKWLYWVRRAHLVLGVFFTPLLTLFILTGCWQTLASDDEKERAGGWLLTLVQHLSTVHTDDYYPPERLHHSHLPFKILVIGMSAGLLISIFFGLILAAKAARAKWLMAVALLLGILIPTLILWLD